MHRNYRRKDRQDYPFDSRSDRSRGHDLFRTVEKEEVRRLLLDPAGEALPPERRRHLRHTD